MLDRVHLLQAVCQRICFYTTKGTGLRNFIVLQANAKLGRDESSYAAEGTQDKEPG